MHFRYCRSLDTFDGGRDPKCMEGAGYGVPAFRDSGEHSLFNHPTYGCDAGTSGKRADVIRHSGLAAAAVDGEGDVAGCGETANAEADGRAMRWRACRWTIAGIVLPSRLSSRTAASSSAVSASSSCPHSRCTEVALAIRLARTPVSHARPCAEMGRSRGLGARSTIPDTRLTTATPSWIRSSPAMRASGCACREEWSHEGKCGVGASGGT